MGIASRLVAGTQARLAQARRAQVALVKADAPMSAVIDPDTELNLDAAKRLR
jgi:hypothetical protein